MALIVNVFLTFWFVHEVIIPSSSVQVQMSPDKCIATMDNHVLISCEEDRGVSSHNKEVALIKLQRNDEDPLVILHQCNNMTYRDDVMGRVQAKGSINNEDNTQSYLHVTLTDPMGTDSGIYSCVLYYADETGELIKEMASTQLTVERLDVKTIEAALISLRNELSSQKDKVKDLEANVLDQKKEILELTDKANTSSAFLVTSKTDLVGTAVKGTLILPDLLMARGDGYDVRKGTFTAPRAGLYEFHLTARTRQECLSDLQLRVNDIAMAMLSAYEKYQWDQSSISVVLDLKAGDVLHIHVLSGSCELHHMFTFFSGILVQAF